MGYSARYHAVTLIAVFLALGIGILIGVGFGDTVVTSAQRDLEESLKGDLADAREARNEALAESRRLGEFAEGVYPALVDGRLRGRRIALVGLGGLPGDVSNDITDALTPTGGRLTSVSVLEEPVAIERLEEPLEDGPFADLARDGRTLERLGERMGGQILGGGRLIQRLRGRLFERVSGRFGGIDGAIVVRERAENPDREERRDFDRLERGVIKGLTDAEVPVVAVERSDAEPSSMDFLQRGRMSTVDNVDARSGRVAMIFALSGAEGDFGSGPRADRLLPDLLPEAGTE